MNKLTNKGVAFFVTAIIFLATVIIAILFGQYMRLDNEFDDLITNNLKTYTEGQISHGRSFLSDIQNTLEALSTMIATTDRTPDEEWLNVILEELGSDNDNYQIDYLTLETIKEGLTNQATIENDTAIYNRVAAGQMAISNINESRRLGGHYFAVVEPVVNHGEVVGALRVRVNAEILAEAEQSSQFFDKVLTCIIDREGNVLYSNNSEYMKADSLQQGLINNNVSGKSAEVFAEHIESPEASAFLLDAHGNDCFIAIDNLGDSNWRVVNFLRERDLLYNYNSIFKSIMGISIFLVAFITAVVVVGCILVMRQRKKLEWESRRYEMLSQFTDTLLFEYNHPEDKLTFTPNALDILDVKTIELKDITKPHHVMEVLEPKHRKILVDILRRDPETVKSGDTGYQELLLKAKDGSYRWFGCHYKYVMEGHKPLVAIGKLSDVSAQVATRKRLEKKARTDRLTNTYNKAGEEVIGELLEKDPVGTFFMLDLDNFKNINDSYGHIAGDAILASVGNYLNTIVRPEDVVARIGGDEFVIFIQGTAGEVRAKEIAGEILSVCNNITLPENGDIKISASVGISFSPLHGHTYQELYNAADQAMYGVKNHSKNNYAIYDPARDKDINKE